MLMLFNNMGYRESRAQPFANGIMPPATEQLRDWLLSAGVKKATLYGSSLYATQLGHPERADDFDLIVSDNDPRWWRLPEKLARAASEVEFSTDHPLQPKRTYYRLYNNLKVDAACMFSPRSPQFMAAQSLFGISAIAADLFTGKVWTLPEFHVHAGQHVIRPLESARDKDDLGLILRYADKMGDKFPGFAIDIPQAPDFFKKRTPSSLPA